MITKDDINNFISASEHNIKHLEYEHSIVELQKDYYFTTMNTEKQNLIRLQKLKELL